MKSKQAENLLKQIREIDEYIENMILIARDAQNYIRKIKEND